MLQEDLFGVFDLTLDPTRDLETEILDTLQKRSFVYCLVCLAAVIGFQVIGWGRLPPPLPARGGWRNTPATAG